MFRTHCQPLHHPPSPRLRRTVPLIATPLGSLTGRTVKLTKFTARRAPALARDMRPPARAWGTPAAPPRPFKIDNVKEPPACATDTVIRNPRLCRASRDTPGHRRSLPRSWDGNERCRYRRCRLCTRQTYSCQGGMRMLSACARVRPVRDGELHPEEGAPRPLAPAQPLHHRLRRRSMRRSPCPADRAEPCGARLT